MEKPRYEMEFWEDGFYHILNPWTGCSIYQHGDKTHVEKILAQHNHEEWQPEF